MFTRLALLVVMGMLVFSTNPGYIRSQISEGVQLDVPFYSQRDETWSEKKLGKSNLTIGTDGCAITSAAMVLQYYDINFDPQTINSAFKDNGGFSGPLMIWAQNKAWQKATNNQIKGVSQYWSYKEDVLINNLDHGRPVVVFLNGRHYVVITGYETVPDPKKPNATRKQYYINDPWAVDLYEGEEIKLEDNLLKVPGTIVQMNVLHTDPVLPVTGPLVDWPAIQEVYSSLGGLEGTLGKPLGKDEESFFNDGRQITIRSQAFENGEIIAYKFQGQDNWKASWIPKEFQDVYDLGKHGLLLGSMYANSTIGGSFVQRVDAEQASFVYQPSDKIVEIITKENGIFAEYFSNQILEGNPVFTRYESDLNFSWQAGSTHPNLSDKYSVRYTMPILVSVPWSRTFVVSASGGVRSYLDEDLLFDEWNNESPEHIELTKWVGKGDHEWIIEYRNTGDSPAFLAGYTEWPVKIVFAAEEGYGAFEGKPDSAPPLDIEIPVEVSPPPFATQVIDDLDPQFSFVDNSNAWDETSSGYNQHSYLSNETLSTSDTAQWNISSLPGGEYELFVYTPANVVAANSANYKVLIDQIETIITVDQKKKQNEWTSLGKYSIVDGTDIVVQLQSTSGIVAADAIAYQQISTTTWSEDIGQKLEDWWNGLTEKVKNTIKDWWEKQKDEIEQAIKDWWNDLQRRIMDWLTTELDRMINQLCFGGFVPITVAVVLTVRSRFKTRSGDPN